MTPARGADASVAALARECRVFCRYLTDREPTGYVMEKYALGHDAIPRAAFGGDGLDRALLACAQSVPWMTGVADAYAGVARRRGLLRHKLILLVAILENAPETHAVFDNGIASARARAIVSMGLLGLGWVARLLVAVPLFGAVHVVTLIVGRQDRG